MTKYFCDKCKQEKLITAEVKIKSLDADMSVGSSVPIKLDLCSECKDLFTRFLKHE